MSVSFELKAEFRDDHGKGASRRLRRTGRVPAVLYGGKREPRAISLDHETLLHQLEEEAFYSHILNIKVGGEEQQAVLKDLQRHPARPLVLHVDLLRVLADEEIRMTVPLHFLGEKTAPGIKQQGGQISHLMTEVDVQCLPKNLPAFIEVDVSEMHIGDLISLTGLKLPEGVALVDLIAGTENDKPVVSLHHLKVAEEPTEEAEGEPGAPPLVGEEKKDEGGSE